MSSDVGHACCYAAKRMRSPRSEIGTPGDVLRDWDTHLLDVARIRAWERLLFVERGDGWIAEEAWRRALKGSACGLDTSPSQVGSRRRATCRTRRSEEHTSELQSQSNLVCRLLLEKKKIYALR